MTDDRTEEEKLADDEKKARGQINRAHQANRLLESELFQGAVEAVKDQIWREFIASDLDDDQKRRNCRVGLEILDRILSQMRHHVQTGKLATGHLTDIEKRRDFLQRLKIRRVV